MSLETEEEDNRIIRANYLWRTRRTADEPPGRSWKPITQEVIDHYGLTWAEMLGTGRARRVAWPRQEAWWLIYQEQRLSLPAIGSRFGRDHTTILHGVRQHAKRLREMERLEAL